MIPRSHDLAACLALLIGTSGCFEPIQNGGVTIVGDPSSRLGTLCRFRHQSEGGVCAEEASAPKPSRVKRIAAAGDGLRGAFATGRPGDYVLENEEIAVVIDQIGARQGLAETGGHLVDAGDALGRIDALGQVVTTLGGLENQAIYETITAGSEKDGTAFVEVSGHSQKAPTIGVTTRYAVAPSSRVVLITTTLINRGSSAIAALDLGDAVLWGGATGGLAGQEAAPSTTAASAIATPYLFAVGTGVAYALVGDGSTFGGASDSGSAGLLLAQPAAGFTTAVDVRGAKLDPSKPESYRRALVVAPRGDTAAIATELFYLTGGSPGAVEITASSEGKAFLRPNENRIVLRRACATCSAATLPDPPSLWISQPSNAPAASEMAPGKYTAKLEGPFGSSPEVPFEIVAGAVTKVALPMKPGGLLRARVVEADAVALAEARAASGHRPPADAADSAKNAAPKEGGALSGKAGPAKIQVLSAASGAEVVPPVITMDGRAEIALPAGKYRVIASRGPELTIDEATVDVAPSAETDLDMAIAHVVETPGYVACDIGARTAKSLDTPVTLGARLRASVAEGIECALFAERDATFDPGPAVDALELGAHLRAFAAATIFGSGTSGVVPSTTADPSSAAILDAWIGRAPPAGEHALDPLWSRLADGHRVTPLAIAFTGAQPTREPGYPRTYVAVPSDDPTKIGASDLASGVAKQDVILTNGPFVTMRIGETSLGGVALSGPKRRATIAVHVERAPWVDATELTLFVGGVAAVTVPLAGTKKTARGAIVEEVTVPLVFAKAPSKTPPGPATVFAPEPTYVVAVVRGERSLGPVLGGDPAEIKPFAVTSPLWLDPGKRP